MDRVPSTRGGAARALPALALAGALLTALRVAAHDPPRVFDAVLDDAGVPDVVLMNRGLLLAAGNGDYAFMCNEALGINTAERAHLATGPAGTLSVVTTAGLQQGSERGCTWSGHSAFEGLALRGFARDPEDAATWYVSTAVNAFDNGVFVTRNAGQTWSRKYSNEPSSVFEHLGVAPSDRQRVYASGLRVSDASFIYFVARSTDGGSSFERFDVALEADEFEVRLLGVHPLDPDTVYAVANSETGTEPLDRFLISHDGGETFSATTEVHVLDAFAITANGDTIWLGGKSGLLRSTNAGTSFEHVGGATFISSLWLTDRGLYIAGHFPPAAQGLALSTDGGETTTLVLDFEAARHALSCGASSTVPLTCERLWSDWVYEQDQRYAGPDAGTTPLDAGAHDASAVDGGTALDADLGATPGAGSSSRSTSAGCNVGPARSGDAAFAIVLAVFIWLRRRTAG